MSETENSGVQNIMDQSSETKDKLSQPERKPRQLTGARKLFATGALGIGIIVAACSGGDKEYHPVTKLPTTQPGVNVIHATETPIPSSTATVEATKTTQPTKTPETTKTTETEIIHHSFQIELDEQVKQLQTEGKALPSGVKVEQYQATIQEELNKFPEVGNLVVKIYFPTKEAIDSGQANDYFLGAESGGPKILLRADRRGDIDATLSLAELNHEVGHFFSISANGQYWKNILTPQEYEQAKQIEYKATHDPNYGLAENQDAFGEYFSDQMVGGTEYPQTDASIETQMACSRKRMLEIELSGLNSQGDETPNPFTSLVQAQLDEINTYANSEQMLQKADYIKDAVAVLDKNKAIVDKISAENPLMAEVYKSIRKNGSALTEQNMARTSSSSKTFNMSGFTEGEAFENLSKWGAVIFLEREYLAGNQVIVDAFKDQDGQIQQFRIDKEVKARIEAVADQIKVQERVVGANTPAGELLTFYSGIAERLSR